jgi:hypothetical protein
LGVACGPGFTLIRLQALRAGPVSVSIPNAKWVTSATYCVLTFGYIYMRTPNRFKQFLKKYPVFTAAFFLLFLCLEINLVCDIKHLHTLTDFHFLATRQRLTFVFAFCEVYSVIFSIVLLIMLIKNIRRKEALFYAAALITMILLRLMVYHTDPSFGW